MPAAHRLQTGDAELGRLLEQPFEPVLSDRREQEGGAGLGCGGAQPNQDFERRVVAVEPVDACLPLAVGGIEDAQGLAGPRPEHGLEVVRSVGTEDEGRAGPKRLVEMEPGVAHAGRHLYPGHPRR